MFLWPSRKGKNPKILKSWYSCLVVTIRQQILVRTCSDPPVSSVWSVFTTWRCSEALRSTSDRVPTRICWWLVCPSGSMPALGNHVGAEVILWFTILLSTTKSWSSSVATFTPQVSTTWFYTVYRPLLLYGEAGCVIFWLTTPPFFNLKMKEMVEVQKYRRSLFRIRKQIASASWSTEGRSCAWSSKSLSESSIPTIGNFHYFDGIYRCPNFGDSELDGKVATDRFALEICCVHGLRR